MTMPSRALAITTGVYVIVTAAAVAAMAVGLQSPSGGLDPGSAPVPQQGVIPPGGIAGANEIPQTQEKSGPSQLSCHRWPSGVWTQTIDPSSPACRAAWDNTQGNGGSTATGVNGSVITIGVPNGTADVDKLVAWFNSQYQLYGRTVRAVSIGPVSTPAQLRAAMASAKEQNVFAVIDADIEATSASRDAGLFVTEAAQRQLVGVTPRPVGRASQLTSAGPYPWSAVSPLDVSARRTADMVCRTLKDRPVAGSSTPRKFAVLVPAGGAAFMATSKVEESALAALKSCGIEAPTFEFRRTIETPADTEVNVNTIQAMSQAGITTAMVFDGDGAEVMFAKGMEASYKPEWVFSGMPWASAEMSYMPEGSNDRVLVTLEGPPVAYAQDEIYRKVFALSGIPAERMDALQGGFSLYTALAVLFAGLQGAGPHLTAASFAFGMETTMFPNVNAGQLPHLQPRVGYALGDHYGERDVALGWWDSAHRRTIKMPEGEIKIKGRLCLVEKGRRFDADHPFPTAPDSLYRDCHLS